MTIVITGASSGIGHELARRYILQGHSLHLMSRNLQPLLELVQLAKERESRCALHSIDVTDFAALQELAKEICQNEPKIDIVIASAGISAGHSFGIQEFEAFKKIIDTNLISVHALFEPFIHKMVEAKSGKLVIISSLASIVAMPTTLAYSASKRALNSYADSLRLSLAPRGISVVNIQPGFIDTAMTRKNRFKMPFLMTLREGVDEIELAIVNSKKIHAFPKIFSNFVSFLSILPLFLRDFLILKLSRSAYEKK